MNATIEISADRLAKIVSLDSGGHRNFEDGCCAMEAIAYIAREPWSDHPECACPVISTFVRTWNDALPDADRTRLLLPLVPRLVGTRADTATEERRSLMAADWLVRVNTPAWLRLAGLDTHADALAGLPEIASLAQAPSMRGPIDAARKDAAAAWAAARAAAGAAAGDAAWDAAWAAARAAAGAAAGDRFSATVTDLQASAVRLIERMVAA